MSIVHKNIYMSMSLALFFIFIKDKLMIIKIVFIIRKLKIYFLVRKG